MKQVKDREQAIKQLEMVFKGMGGNVSPIHVPVLARVYQSLKEEKEISIDDFIILAVYRDTVRRSHLIELNKHHPSHKKKTNKGASFYKTPEYRAKLRKAQKGRKHSPETIAKRMKKIKATWAAKRAAKEKST